MPILKSFSSLLLCGTLALGSLPLQAETDDPEAWIEYRGSLMDSMKSHNKAAKKALTLGGDHLMVHARALQATAALIAGSFPEGSDFGETDAKAAVWEDREGFQAATQKYAKAVDALVQAAAAGDADAITQALNGVGKGCKGCHEDYRER